MNNIDIVEILEKKIRSGMLIPKPFSELQYKIKGYGMRRGEKAVIYTIPGRKNLNNTHEKGINFSEFEKAFEHLNSSGELSSNWFKLNLSECKKEGGCNFTTIGGIFELLGLANSKKIGKREVIYIKK